MHATGKKRTLILSGSGNSAAELWALLRPWSVFRASTLLAHTHSETGYSADSTEKTAAQTRSLPFHAFFVSML